MKKLVTLLLATLVTTGFAVAQENKALLDLLVRKKIITAEEAKVIQAEAVKEEAKEKEKFLAATSENKLKLTSSVTELKLGGDLRLRYQYESKDPQTFTAVDGDTNVGSPTGSQRSRYRFRLRLNADFKLGKDFFGGVQLVTGQASDSDNQTYENGFNDYDIFISRAYLGWKAADWLTVTAGKVPNPFYTTELVWDADINPTGLTQSIKFHKLFSLEDEADAGLSKDGKTVAAVPADRPWELTVNLGEFLYDDNLESNFDSDSSDDAYLFAAQIVGTYKTDRAKFTFAPGVMFTNAADLSGLNNENSFTDTDVSGETRKFVVITAPGDVSFKLGNLPTKFYWDFAWNTQGKGRADDIYGLVTHEVDGDPGNLTAAQDYFAWLVGLQLGENKKAGDWSFNLNFRSTGIAAVDPNLNESDFALGELNTRGFKGGLFYNFTDFLNAGVTYMYGWNLNDDLAHFLGDANDVQILQLDVNLKF